MGSKWAIMEPIAGREPETCCDEEVNRREGEAIEIQD